MVKWKKNVTKLVVAFVMLMTCILGFHMSTEASQVPTPAKVTGLKQNAYQKDAVGLSWNVQSDNNILYEVYREKVGSPSVNKTDRVKGPGGLNGFYTGSTYYIRVRAYVKETASSQAVYGPWSSTIRVVTSPSVAPTNVRQIKATETSATISWKAVKGATDYIVLYKKVGSSKVIETSTKSSSITLSRLVKNDQYVLNVYACRKESTTIKATNREPGRMSTWVVPRPTKPTSFKFKKATGAINDYIFGIKPNTSAAGLQFQVRNSSNKVIYSGNSSYTGDAFRVRSSKVKSNQFHKIRVRGYIKLGSTNVYGAWSEDMWFSSDTAPNRLVKSGTAVKVTWPKTTGASNYTVYISTSKKNYNKVGTTSGNTITIKKCGKNAFKPGTLYYISIKSNKKVGSKIFSSSFSEPRYFTYR